MNKPVTLPLPQLLPPGSCVIWVPVLASFSDEQWYVSVSQLNPLLPKFHWSGCLITAIEILTGFNMWQNKTITWNLDQTNQQMKRPNWTHKNQRPTRYFTQETHENTKLEAMRSIHRIPGADPGRSCACCCSLWGFISALLLLFWLSFLGVLDSFLLLHPFSLFFCRAPELWREGVNGDCPFRAGGSKVCHGLCIWLWVSVFVPTCCKRKLSWWCLNKPLFYVYSRISPGVISSLF